MVGCGKGAVRSPDLATSSLEALECLLQVRLVKDGHIDCKMSAVYLLVHTGDVTSWTRWRSI